MSFGHGINCIIVKVTPSLVTKLFYNAEQALPDNNRRIYPILCSVFSSLNFRWKIVFHPIIIILTLLFLLFK